MSDSDIFKIFNHTKINNDIKHIVNMTLLSWNKFSSVLMGVTLPENNSPDFTFKTGMFYMGCTWLQPLANATGLSLDKINFLVTCFSCIFIGVLFRLVLPPHRVGPYKRGILEAVLGSLALLFCFGNQIRVLILQAAVAYLLMICIPCRKFAAISVTIWSMIYLTAVHLCRLHYDYGGYTVDISGPIMIATQKLSSLGFNLLDGEKIRQKRESEIKDSQETLNHDFDPMSRKPRPKMPSLRPNDEENVSQVIVRSTAMAKKLQNSLENVQETEFKQQHDSPPDFQSDECLIADDITPIIVDDKDPLGSDINNQNSVNGQTNQSKRSSFRNSLQALNPTQLPKILNVLKPNMDDVQNMPETHKKHAVEKMPNPLEFAAYMLYFEGSMVGPFVFYSDYRAYLSGYGNRTLPTVSFDRSVRLFVQIIITGLLTAYVSPKFPFDLVNSHTFKEIPFLQKIIFSLASLFLIRQKYYFAWSLGEAMNISAGNGYSGINEKTGETEWAHVSNFEFSKIECDVGLKHVVDGWNISTTHWLREVFYDRVPAWCKTLTVFMISAFWHGFYPGYYIMFLTFAIFTFTSRTWRREMRRRIRVNETAGKAYDVFTTILTSIAMNYAQVPFHLLELKTSAVYWLHFYYVPHIVALVILICGSLKTTIAGCCRRKYRKAKGPTSVKPA